MSAKLGGVIAVVALLAGVGLYISGKHAGTLAEQSLTAQKIRATAEHVADSVVAVYSARFDSAARESAQAIKTADANANAAARSTNAVIARNTEIGKQAERLLADSSATRDSLRAELRTTLAALDSTASVIQAERQAATDARLTRDSTHAREMALREKGFGVVLAAKDSAAATATRAYAFGLQDARASGVRAGIVRGGIASALLVAAIVFAVK